MSNTPLKLTLNVLILIIVVVISCKSAKPIESINKSTIATNYEKLNYINYFVKINEADSLYLVDDFKGSYEILDSIFKIYAPLNSDNYVEYGVYLNSAVMTGNLKNIEDKVRFAYLNFGNIQTHHKNGFEMYLAVNKIAKITDGEIKDLKLKYYNNLDLILRKKMLEMYKLDQEVRIHKKSDYEMNKVDEMNRLQLNYIFEKYGFPTKKLIGSNNAYDVPDNGSIYLNIFFMHQPDSIRSKYLPILLEGLKKGYCEPQIYAIVYDRDLILKGKKQYYGTYLCANDEVCPVEFPNKIDSIRKSIGLPHLKYYPWKIKQLSSN
jgi:hypothetical protein